MWNWKEVLYDGYYTHHYSWDWPSVTWSKSVLIFGRKMGPDNANPSITLSCPLNLSPSAAFWNVCWFLSFSLPFSFSSLFQETYFSFICLLSRKFWCLLIMLATEHSAVCKFDPQLRFCSSKDVQCVSKAGTLVAYMYTKTLNLKVKQNHTIMIWHSKEKWMV